MCLEPILTNTNLNLQPYAKIKCGAHGFFDQRTNRLNLVPRHIKNQLVMHLQHHP